MAHELDIIPGTEWGFFTLPRPMCIAGPCSAETEEQVMETAKGLNDFGIHVYRAGIWKPRTHPGSFEGVGTQGLKWLRRVKQELGMKVCTEVASENALEGTDIPVLVKNPVNPDLDLWIGALERLNRAGLRKLGVIHRGFSTSASIPYRNDPGWKIAIELRTRYPQMAFFADPSHMAGDRKYLLELSQRAMDLGLDGLMVESHCDPSCALSDAKQQLTPADLQHLLESLVIRENTSENEAYKEGIDALRARIDVIDENLLKLLKDRMGVSQAIGQYKKEHNVAILQAGRWEQLLSGMVERGAALGISADAITAIMTAIHDESVRVQNRVLEG